MNWFFASLPLLIFILLTWIALGLLVVRFVFKRQEGLTVFTLALPVGLFAYLLLVNTLSYFIFVPITMWVVNIGVWIAVFVRVRRGLPPLVWEIDERARRLLVVGGVLLFAGVLFVNAREIWIDTEGHAAMVQLLASGQFPMQFQCNVDELAAYQYGGNLLAAAVVDTANITPWDAQDVLVAYQAVCLASLAILLVWRRTKSLKAGLLAIFLMATIGHVVWLLQPLITPGLGVLSAPLPQTAELTYYLDSLTISPWDYAVVSPGFLTPTLGHAHRSLSWNFGPLTILLFLALLETPFERRWLKGVTLAYILGSVSLVQPSGLFMLAGGLGGIALLTLLQPRRFSLDFNPWMVIALSVVIAVIQGGIITDGIKARLAGVSSDTTSFSLRSPMLPTCNLGPTTFACVVLSFANMGAAPLLLPVLAALTFKGRKDNVQIVVVLGAVAAYVLPMMLNYGYMQWNILRVISFASWVVIVFMTPWLYRHLVAGGGRRWATVALLVTMSYSGVIALWITITGTAQDARTSDFSPMVPPNDLDMMRFARGIPLDALIFDSKLCSGNTGSRPAYLFGRYTRNALSRDEWYVPPEGFETLLKRPTTEAMREAGYTYVYVDHNWYYSLDQSGKDDLKQGNYDVVAVTGDETDFRLLLRACSAEEQCQTRPEVFPLETPLTDAPNSSSPDDRPLTDAPSSNPPDAASTDEAP